MVKVYPNPGNGRFNIQYSGIINDAELHLYIYDAMGNAVYQTEERIKTGQVQTYDCGDLKTGVYLIRIIIDDKITTMKYNLVK
jgi:hypothetical protein